MTLGSAFAREGGNNFDLVRLGAALLVLFSHSFVLTGRADDEPVAWLFRHFIDGGGLAVAAFFVLSGFLIAGSAERHSMARYARARALRIYPAYLVVIGVQTLGVGVLMTRLGVGPYLADPAVWVALARGAVFSPAMGLPGVFEANPLPLQVNGSLWTLRVEVVCYMVLAAAAWCGVLRRGWVLGGVVLGYGLLGAASELPRVLPIVECGLYFGVGAAFWCWRDRVVLRGRLVVLGAVALVGVAGTGMAPLVWHAVLPYVVLGAGLTRPVAVAAMRRLGDVSYGTYLFAFPIQQCLVAWLAPSPGVLAALAVPPTLLCAVLSRRLIEVPALRHKRH